MEHKLSIYDSYTRDKRVFQPIHAPHVGMYVCGPTVYNEVHLGNCRTFLTFDLVYRCLTHLGYKVRYVRNITDVGHLEGDTDCDAESKIEQRARLEQLEPMEIVQKYTNRFHEVMRSLNLLPPSIEPSATGHIVEQIEMVKQILANGYAYEANGSVYFDTQKLLEADLGYGQLSGRKAEDLLAESRDNLKNQSEKRHPADFAIWVKADARHLMRWPSPWGEGFPGWHLECSAMSTKYLGKRFDIHGGGMDLQFPHHENEIAQNIGACGCQPVNYWMHGNMLLLNGRKMSKSDGYFILPADVFSHTNTEVSQLSKAYSPMVLRFFMLQAHYRSTLNITDKGLQGAEGALQRLMQAYARLEGLQPGPSPVAEEDQIHKMLDLAWAQLFDDFNTAEAIGKLFAIVPKINLMAEGKLQVSAATLQRLKTDFHALLFDIFGLLAEGQSVEEAQNQSEMVQGLMELILELRQNARQNKDFSTSDAIRDHLAKLGIQVKDSKAGAVWEQTKV